MIKKEKYNHNVDIWALGVLLYEMMHNDSPFNSDDN